MQVRCVHRITTCVGWPARGGGSGRIFMAKKIFYHNNTEIRHAGSPLLSSLSFVKVLENECARDIYLHKKGFVPSFSLAFFFSLVVARR